MPHLSHRLLHAAIAAAYASACFGLDKTLVSGVLAALYLLLSLPDPGPR